MVSIPTLEKNRDKWTYKQAGMYKHTHIQTHTLGACVPDILQSTMGAWETVMDYRHIWTIISRSHIPPVFSRRQNSCIMFPRARGYPGCMNASCHYCIYQSEQSKRETTVSVIRPITS